ncbi:MAG: transposase [Desulfovibrionales bacterium]|nr:transposase [Desulfovibrionales bacterium]
MRKGGQECRKKEIGARVLNTLSRVLDGSVEFSRDPRAVYGRDEWMAILAEMGRSGTTAADAIEALKEEGRDVPSERWFLDVVHSIRPAVLQSVCDGMVSETARLAIREGVYSGGRGATVGIDKHLIGRYDRNNMRHLAYSEPKNGTKRFEAYATMQIVGGPINATLRSARVTRGTDNVDFVREFMRVLDYYNLRTRLVLLDREFYAVDVTRAIAGSGRDFLMPAVRNARVKRLIEDFDSGTGGAVVEHTIRNSRGEESSFRLVIVRRAGDRGKKAAGGGEEIADGYAVFATSLPASRALSEIGDLPEEYRGRWGIETGYRQIESVRPWTTSRDDAYRRFLFAFALFLYNMWAIERARAGARLGNITLRMLARMALAVARQRLPAVPDDPGGRDPGTGAAARHVRACAGEAAAA